MPRNQKSRIDGRLYAGLKKSKSGICKILHKNEVDRLLLLLPKKKQPLLALQLARKF